ncbi:tRNA dihydrouridine synthase [Sorochytrium milnesiophthora]
MADTRQDDNAASTQEKIARRVSPVTLFDARRSAGDYVKICAPMVMKAGTTHNTVRCVKVRYSKLAFRDLVRHYNTDIAYTPMILADVFKNSPFARNTEFTTHVDDEPVVLQFAASSAHDLSAAAELAAPYVNAVDINCGCPQKWAYKDKIGAYLMEQPELVRDMVRAVREKGVPCSIKIRVHKDLRETVELARRAEKVGVEWITVHGRTRLQKSTTPVDVEGVKLVKSVVGVPVVANGDIFQLSDAEQVVKETGVDGVMAARGLLRNPALFSGATQTPMEAAKMYLHRAISYGTHPFVIHHHLMFMLDDAMSGWEKKRFNVCTSVPSMLDWLDSMYGWTLPCEATAQQ